jgi:beta-lactamase superfamily II metal-dependent hydrolase
MLRRGRGETMSELRITLIDVGWGDSILIESTDASGKIHCALIDSNDTGDSLSSFLFLKRHFEKRQITTPTKEPLFDWIMLSHGHADHGQGLKGIVRSFGAKRLLYPRMPENDAIPFFTALIMEANGGKGRIGNHQAVDEGTLLEPLGDATLDILWPPAGYQTDNLNNKSIVLAMTLGEVSAVLTGDAEGEVWDEIAGKIPANTRFLKVPHHGSKNGTFSGRRTPWLDNLSPEAMVGISCHIRPFNFHHPHKPVLDAIEKWKKAGANTGGTPAALRTDVNYHLTFTTDGTKHEAAYSH